MQGSLGKRINELLVLAVLDRGPAHGYQIALSVEESTDGAFSFQHGTLYPILHRLESTGHVKGEWDEETGRGRRKKTYSITSAGQAFLKADSDQLESELRALFGLLRSDAGAA
ncbi:MAG: helix-turn-helix transcriptional regulator [Gemmatimonadetes bacterium]|nr:helix-turn-helix transcriptional regulator [Gemmatimonadota bacterium]